MTFMSTVPAVETASEPGVDPNAKTRPCEHRPEWMRGRLCLACDNTGLRANE